MGEAGDRCMRGWGAGVEKVTRCWGGAARASGGQASSLLPRQAMLTRPAPPLSCLSLALPSPQAVFFKMRVAGVLHIFQFETKQGEDICMALQTHINDIMMKRYSKAKAAQDGGADISTGGRLPACGGRGHSVLPGRGEEGQRREMAGWFVRGCCGAFLLPGKRVIHLPCSALPSLSC